MAICIRFAQSQGTQVFLRVQCVPGLVTRFIIILLSAPQKEKKKKLFSYKFPSHHRSRSFSLLSIHASLLFPRGFSQFFPAFFAREPTFWSLNQTYGLTSILKNPWSKNVLI